MGGVSSQAPDRGRTRPVVVDGMPMEQAWSKTPLASKVDILMTSTFPLDIFTLRQIDAELGVGDPAIAVPKNGMQCLVKPIVRLKLGTSCVHI